MSNKKYRLLKDWQGIAKKGRIIEWSEESQLEYAKMFGKEDEWPEIRDCWFEEVKEETVEFRSFNNDGKHGSGLCVYKLWVSSEMGKDLFQRVQQVIENVLNEK